MRLPIGALDIVAVLRGHNPNPQLFAQFAQSLIDLLLLASPSPGTAGAATTPVHAILLQSCSLIGWRISSK